MKQASPADVALDSKGKPRDKRTKRPHHKTKTGCRTCRYVFFFKKKRKSHTSSPADDSLFLRIRRLRCDEARPACRRCESTGRRCDGYATVFIRDGPEITFRLAETEPSPVTLRPLSIHGWRSQAELRTYRYFIDIIAPSMAGALYVDFWLVQLPRFCHSTESIWQAIMSLGLSYEAYTQDSRAAGALKGQAQRHSSAAIKDFTQSVSSATPKVALVLSTIFTYICLLDGQFDVATLHFRGGYSIIRGIEGSRARECIRATPAPCRDDTHVFKSANDSLISSVKATLIDFEMLLAKVDASKISQPPTLISEESSYSVWQRYQTPRKLTTDVRTLTATNLSTAVQAAESLLMALMTACFDQAQSLRIAYMEGGYSALGSVTMSLPIHKKVFRDIKNVTDSLRTELGTASWSKSKQTLISEFRKGLEALQLIQAANRFLLYQDCADENTALHELALKIICSDTLEHAERFLNLQKSIGSSRTSFSIPVPGVMTAVIIIAKSGFGEAIRQEAIRMLARFPMEGIWDPRMAVGMTDFILRREREATEEYRDSQLPNVFIPHPMARSYIGNGREDSSMHSLSRISNASISFTSGRSIDFEARTWKEWLNGECGKKTHIKW